MTIEYLPNFLIATPYNLSINDCISLNLIIQSQHHHHSFFYFFLFFYIIFIFSHYNIKKKEFG